MPFADLHCDTISALETLGRDTPGLRAEPSLHINLEKLKTSGYVLQNFALFVDLQQNIDPWAKVCTLAQVFRQEMARNRDRITQAVTFRDMETARRDGKIAAVLTVEEGGVLQSKPERLTHLRQLGVRMMTLTWNYPNELARPNGQPGGLTDTGVAVLGEMERLGIVPDLSHLGDDGIRDVLRLAKRPVAASHSNCRALHPHRRNLTDERIRAIADRGGVIGVNFYADFLGNSPVSRTEDMLRHMRHMMDVGGLSVVALGSDFDGIDCPLELGDAGTMERLTQAMDRGGFTPREIEAITWKNVWDFYREVL